MRSFGTAIPADRRLCGTHGFAPRRPHVIGPGHKSDPPVPLSEQIRDRFSHSGGVVAEYGAEAGSLHLSVEQHDRHVQPLQSKKRLQVRFRHERENHAVDTPASKNVDVLRVKGPFSE